MLQCVQELAAAESQPTPAPALPSAEQAASAELIYTLLTAQLKRYGSTATSIKPPRYAEQCTEWHA